MKAPCPSCEPRILSWMLLASASGSALTVAALITLLVWGQS